MPPRKAILIAAITTAIWTGCCLGLARHIGFPEPAIHDEFDYLLGADTFVHGRLANPPHPLGRFFESPQILVRPKYMSIHPPGQALFLALGQKVFGAPYYGVAISGAAMVFLITLALFLWSSPLPAIAVSIVMAARFLPPMYWVYSYWGGCVAAAGGAAVMVAWALYRRGCPVSAGFAYGAGIMTLFFSRPFEGGAFAAAATGAAIVVLVRERGREVRAQAGRFLGAACPVIVAGALWAGWYDARITGNPILLPYVLHAAQYSSVPPVWVLPPWPEPAYSHPRLAAQHGRNGEESRQYRHTRSERWYEHCKADFMCLYGVFGGTLVLLALVPFAWRDWRVRSVGATFVACLLAVTMDAARFAHYAAPLTASACLLAAFGLESWRSVRAGSLPIGIWFSGAIVAGALALPLFSATSAIAQGTNHPTNFGTVRAGLIRTLSELDGNHLVIVRYPSPDWQVASEWVYNGADIDSQRVVFAHDLGTRENEELLRYYPARRKWLLTVSGPAAPGSAMTSTLSAY